VLAGNSNRDVLIILKSLSVVYFHAALQHSFRLFITYFAKIKLPCANISEVLSIHDLWAQHQKLSLETSIYRACSQLSLQKKKLAGKFEEKR
jgi:hypothetical protein